MDLEQLRKFLVDLTSNTYAAGMKSKLQEDGSHTLVYGQGDFKMNDNFFGGEPYGGRMVIHYKSKPAWMMVYYGAVDKAITDFNPVYEFLKKALRSVPEEMPLRGPRNLKEGEWEYKNEWEGALESYSGREVILKNGREIFFTDYSGGLIDQAKLKDINN